MKNNYFLALLFASFASHTAFASDLKKIDSTTATKTIVTKDVQAANFVDAKEINDFLKLLEKDANSPLRKLMDKIWSENNCKGSEAELALCGKIVISQRSTKSSSRAGWANAGASYRFMIGFQEASTGHEYEANYIFEVTENVEAVSEKPTADKTVSFLKTLHYNGSRDISRDILN